MPTKREYIENKINSDLSNGRKMYNYLVNFVSRMGLRDAEDIIQEAYIRILTSSESYKRPFNNLSFFEDSDLRKWTTTIAINKARDELRKRKRGKEICECSLEGSKDYSLLESITQTGSHYPEEDESTQIRKAIKNLKYSEKEVIDQFYFLKYSHRKMSEILGLPLGTIRFHLFSAKKNLRKMPLLQEIWENH